MSETKNPRLRFDEENDNLFLMLRIPILEVTPVPT